MKERGDGKSFTNDELARWALTSQRIKRELGYADRLVEGKLAEEFSQAMREAYGTDKRGRNVREMYSARVGGKPRWNSRDLASRGFGVDPILRRFSGSDKLMPCGPECVSSYLDSSPLSSRGSVC